MTGEHKRIISHILSFSAFLWLHSVPSGVAHRGFLIESPVWLAGPVGSQGGDSFGSSSSVKISRVGPAPRHSKWAHSWAPGAPLTSEKEAGSCSSAALTKSWRSQSNHRWHFFHNPDTLYASDIRGHDSLLTTGLASGQFIFHLTG